MTTSILIVDDDPLLRELIKEYVIQMGYDTVEAADGIEAWSILEQDKHRFDAIVLDRKMPNMNGLELLKKIKAHPDFSMIPVIMQTGSGNDNEILEGLQAGCYYYLIKPFERAMFESIVKTAVSDHLSYRQLQEELQKQSQSLALLDSGSFSFRDLNESLVLTKLLAAACPEPDKVATGISELLINAVEHGNLEISYAEKSHLLAEQEWEHEVESRLNQPKFADRIVSVQFERGENEISIVIKDQGKGFEWQQYLEMSPERSGDSHGRGIAMAKMISFNHIEYQGKGNEVKVTIDIEKAAEEIPLKSATH